MVMAEPLTIDGSRPFRAGMLADALVDGGHAVTWWTSTFDHSHKRHRYPTHHTIQLRPGLELRMLHGPAYRRNVSLTRIRHNHSVARTLDREWRAQRPDLDLLFVCIPLHELAKVALQFGKRHRVPVVLDVRDPWPEVYLQLVPRTARPLLRAGLIGAFQMARKNFRLADAVVAVSESYLAWARRLGRRTANSWDRTFPLGYPAVMSHLPPPVAAPSRRPFVVAFVGTFGAGYDLETVVLAATRLAQQSPDVQFVLAGDGDDKARLRTLARAATNIDFPGWLSQDGVTDLLARAAVGLVAYRQSAVQSLPNKPFEYWAAGLPILSSLPGELARIIDHEGVGVNYRPGDPDSLAEAVKWLVEHEDERLIMARRALALFQEQFSAAKIYPELVRHLEKIAQSLGGRSGIAGVVP